LNDLAPHITRQRLLIEGLYATRVDRAFVESYMRELAEHLGLRAYGTPIVHAPEGAGKNENEGFDAFMPLVDSGISLYVWTESAFFATVLFTCKHFDEANALAFTAQRFDATALEHRSF
tara:strand:- start:110 stop:466 length:357 start_codon:yes stop_codon:yes gene_type:complete